jgi:hypothetical protein
MFGWPTVNPLGTMLLQAVIGVCPEAPEDFIISSFDLSITLWMSYGHIADLDAKILTVSLEHATGELGPVVGDHPVRDPKPADDGLDELDRGLLVDLDHNDCFRPVGELVDDDIQIPDPSDGPMERAQDVQPPYDKWA